MAVTGVLFCIVTELVFGLPLWFKFFDTLSWFNTTIVQNGEGGIWCAMPTVFALARRMGASLLAACALHAAVAVPAVLATAILRACRAWFAKRCAATVVSTLLVQPYLIYYDLAWLILPVISLCVDGRVHGVWTRVERLIIGLAWVLPLPAFLTVFKPSIGQ